MSNSGNTSSIQKRRPYSYNDMTSPQPSCPTPTPATTRTGSISKRRGMESEMTSSTLLKSNPVHHQTVYKLKVPFIYKFTPTPLLTFLQYTCYPLLAICNIKLKPHWVERYFILVGNYLYKFQSKRSSSGDMAMKGSPIPLETISLSSLQQLSNGVVGARGGGNANGLVGIDIDVGLTVDAIPTQHKCNGYFSIKSNSKTSIYATSTQLDAQTWINVLRNARQECITHNMGHSKIPISREVEYANMMGKRILERKKRISDLMKKKELEEVELMCLHGNGNGPRGMLT